MQSDWILDVLADLRRFAEANDLPLLAEQLDDTALIATAEFASRNEGSAKRGHVSDAREIGEHSVRLGAVGQP